MSLPATAKWVALALIGLAIAIGVAIAAANLAGQQIGISSESVTAGDRLAPAFESHHGGKNGGQTGPSGDHGGEPEEPETTAPEETVPAEPREEPSGSDDHGGQGSDSDD
jgi:hypothetical protein